MKVIQQSSSVVVSFGPFVDKTDGFTELSGLVSALDNATTGIKLSKNGGTLAVRHATVTASVYDAQGYYKVTLDTTDTNSLGLCRMIYSDPATCLPVWEDLLVIPAAVKAPLAGTALLTTNVTQWLTAAAPAMSGDAFASLATLLTRIASTLTITSGKVDVNDKTGFSISGTKTTLDALNDIAAAAVWSVATRTLTSFGTLASDVATSVWGAGTRTLSSFGTLVADVATAVWGAGTKVLTGFGTLVADVATAVWGAGTKALTDKAGFTISGTTTTLDALATLIRGADNDTLKTISDQIDLQALETTLTAIKGSGWTTETLKAIKEYVDDLETRLSAVRAGYLDNLSAGPVAKETGGNLADIKADVEHATYGLNALLTAISTRMAAFTYTAPDNADIQAVKTDVEHATYGLNALLTAINLRLAAAAYIAPDNTNIGLIKTKTDNLPGAPAAAGDIPSAATVATAVWANTTRTLSGFGTLVADIATAVWGAVTRTLTTGAGITAADVWGYVTRTLTDKTGFSISGTKQTLDALHDLSTGEIDARLEAFDPPTKAELDAAVATIEWAMPSVTGLAIEANVQSHAAAALTAYDPPTRAEATSDKAEIEALVEKVRKAVSNRLVVDPATGAFTVYADDGTTPLFTGTISGTGRSAPTWL